MINGSRQEFIGEVRLGRALTKTFIHMPFVGITVPTKEKHKKHKVADGMSSELGVLN